MPRKIPYKPLKFQTQLTASSLAAEGEWQKREIWKKIIYLNSCPWLYQRYYSSVSNRELMQAWMKVEIEDEEGFCKLKANIGSTV